MNDLNKCYTFFIFDLLKTSKIQITTFKFDYCIECVRFSNKLLVAKVLFFSNFKCFKVFKN